MLIETIFKGEFSKLHFDFLKYIVGDSKEVYCNTPEIHPVKNYSEAIAIIQSNTYVDFVINTDMLRINEYVVPNVFINLGRNYEEVDILMFFELNDITGISERMKLECLKSWMIDFTNENNIDYYICQMDNANEDDYYFDSKGLGPLYFETND